MKTLATCKPTEFLSQANKIKKYAEKWIKDTKIIEIYERQPTLETVPADGTVEEKREAFNRNKQKAKEQTRQNLSDIFDSILETNPDETMTLIALCCFVEPNDIDNHKVGEYLTAIAELIGDEAVISFFTSLARLGVNISSPASKKYE